MNRHNIFQIIQLLHNVSIHARDRAKLHGKGYAPIYFDKFVILSILKLISKSARMQLLPTCHQKLAGQT